MRPAGRRRLELSPAWNRELSALAVSTGRVERLVDLNSPIVPMKQVLLNLSSDRMWSAPGTNSLLCKTMETTLVGRALSEVKAHLSFDTVGFSTRSLKDAGMMPTSHSLVSLMRSLVEADLGTALTVQYVNVLMYPPSHHDAGGRRLSAVPLDAYESKGHRSWHSDPDHEGPVKAVLTLSGAAVVAFAEQKHAMGKSGVSAAVLARSGVLYAFAGDARYCLYHAVFGPLMHERVAIECGFRAGA